MNFIKYCLFYFFVLTEGSTCFCFKILFKIFQLVWMWFTPIHTYTTEKRNARIGWWHHHYEHYG